MWERGGYNGAGNVEPLLGSKAGPCLIAGGARSVFDDVRWCLERIPEADVLAINDVGMFLHRITHWATLHNFILPTITTRTRLEAWVDVRRSNHDGTLNFDFTTHADRDFRGVNYAWLGLTCTFGLSGYFGMQIAYLMGYDPIILCGCPGSPAPRFFDPSCGKDWQAPNFPYQRDMIEREMKRLPLFKKKVRSMSGWTMDFFGHPESELEDMACRVGGSKNASCSM